MEKMKGEAGREKRKIIITKIIIRAIRPKTVQQKGKNGNNFNAIGINEA